MGIINMTKLIAFGILFTLIGAILVIIGLILWKKQKISLIHDYHYTKVKTEDIKPYTKAMGKATIATGLSTMLMGALEMITYIPSYMGGLIFIIGLIVSGIMFYMAQKKYNKGMF
jgi:hypothetical protein